MSLTIKQTLEHIRNELETRGFNKDWFVLINDALALYGSLMRATMFTEVENIKESLILCDDENSNIRKILFEAVKLLAPIDRTKIKMMIEGKTIAEGGFTNPEEDAARDWDHFYKTIEGINDELAKIAEAPNAMAPHGKIVITYMVNDHWHAAMDKLLSDARAFEKKQQPRELTLNEMLEKK